MSKLSGPNLKTSKIIGHQKIQTYLFIFQDNEGYNNEVLKYSIIYINFSTI